MINFATLQGLTIPEGVVAKIMDASGRVLWKKGGVEENVEPAVLEVEKITADTYAGETTYTGEEFILLDIYPQAGATVSVTYGGLTKTITDTSGAESPNAQQVFFGTFNGVTDDVATPASGTLVIKGKIQAFGCGVYRESKTAGEVCSCITSIAEWGIVTVIPNMAFKRCAKLSIGAVPEGVTKIEHEAFFSDGGDGMYESNIILPSSLKEMYLSAFATYPVAADDDYSITARNFIMLATTPPMISDSGDTFDISLDSRIIVPKGCGDTYKSAEGWKKFGSRIVEET